MMCANYRVCDLHFTYMKWMNNVPYLCPPLELHSVIPEGREPYLRNYFTNLRFSYSYSFIIVYTLGQTISEVSPGKISHSDFLQTLIILGSRKKKIPTMLYMHFHVANFFFKEPNRSGWAKHCRYFPWCFSNAKKCSVCYECELLFCTHPVTQWEASKRCPQMLFKKFTSNLYSSQVFSIICCGKETMRITQMGDNWKNPSILLVRWLVQFCCQNLLFLKNVCVWKLWSVTRNSRWKPN